MSTALYFLYDSHCPWSYATTPLIKAITKAYPEIEIHLLHCAYYDGEQGINQTTIGEVSKLSKVDLGAAYQATIGQVQDSTLVANLMAWVQNKSEQSTLALLTQLQTAHFVEGKSLINANEIEAITQELKLSPPAKCLKSDKFTKDAQYVLSDVEEIQEIIGTQSIPALLLAHNDDLVLLNHNLYIGAPEKITEAVAQEINK